MPISERAAGLFDSGYNCAQSVFLAQAEALGLDQKDARAVANGFGHGMNAGEVCGAVVGAVMAIGCAFPELADGRPENKVKMRKLTKQLTEAFRAEYGNLRCADLLANGAQRGHCRAFVSWSAQKAEEIIKDFQASGTEPGKT